MTHLRARTLSDRLTSRRGAWISLGIGLIGFVLLFGLFARADAPAANAVAPADSESARVSALMQTFPDADRQSVLLVAVREDGAALSADDQTDLAALPGALDPSAASQISGPIVSDDGQAALLVVPITTGASNGETAEVVAALRDEIAGITPSGLTIEVTGGPAFGADVAAAFEGADFTLLAVTILIVAVLLIVTYRSPVLWLLPLVVVAFADQLAGKATAAAGAAWNLQFDAGIISVLVFGAGTNYALLLISRYREELFVHQDHRAALSAAWRKTAPAILASNVTVVLALLTLVLAVIPGTQGLGISSAIGLLIALAAVLLVLPPLLAVCGRKIFWPFVPRPDAPRRTGGVWQTIAANVVKRPRRSLVAGLALLSVMALGLIGTSVGLDQAEKFRVPSESAAGLQTLSEHFPAGEAQPIFVVATASTADDVIEVVRSVPGVLRAHTTGEASPGGLATIMVTGEYSPGTPESLALVEDLRDAVHEIDGAGALVGGAVATDLDARAGNQADLLLIAPLVLAVSFLVLLILLRAIVAPVLLLLVNIISAVAAIGAGAWLSRVLFDQPALDLQVPLLSFLFLVALGIDYTIFLVHRARAEARTLGTREGMVQAVAHTGGVITSAGIVLAAVFAALGVLPLVTLGQLGLIVGIGVIVDTLVVRTVIVPALFGLLGDRMWWPGVGRRAAGDLPERPLTAEASRESVRA
ncbi:RND superfamily putative drug exporter [Microbacterium keratanolyticum]|uniref:Membrane protein n=1 Tax=Microbacterium keratanolyticum TaxID=67574 RepID=A0A9W6HQ90_9MICO|nr:MMPL family transporter [Microbacterium keratanolyticum]MBM7468326.1 RND superfamily putative drug exporter [Microbacterium keratanolyticum]GLK00400.1 membrane protein [Microbacterium keratanolyticum]